MKLTRKNFLQQSGRVVGGLGGLSLFGFGASPRASFRQDSSTAASIASIHGYLRQNREAHIAALQGDIRQPSFDRDGSRGMAARMKEALLALGCQEVEAVGDTGIWAFHDSGAAKTIVVHLYYSTSPFAAEEWVAPPLDANRTSYAGFNDVLIGRGALAAKGPNRFFLGACEAIKAVHGSLPVNIMFVGNGEDVEKVINGYRSRLVDANCFLNPAAAQGPDGEVTTYLGYKGMLTLEFVCEGQEWGRGPQHRPMYTSRATVVDSVTWRLIDAMRSMYDPQANRILVGGYYEAIREPSAEEAALMTDMITRQSQRLFAYESDNIESFRNDWSPETAARHLMFDTTFNIRGVSVAGSFPHRASAFVDSRLVPNQEPQHQVELIRQHLDASGFGDIAVRVHGAGRWSQTSVDSDPVQAVLATYRRRGYDPLIWPRYPGSHNEYLFTRSDELGLPAARGGLGCGGNDHAPNEYIVVGEQGRVAGIVEAEASIAEILMNYGAL